MFPFPTIIPSLGVTELAYVSSSKSTGYASSITFPADIQEGDILIVGQQYGDSDDTNESDYTANTGTGFTSAGSAHDPGINWVYQHAVSYKLADGTEASASIGGFMPKESGANTTAAIFVYRPNFLPTTLTLQDEYSYGGTGNPAAYVINASDSALATICVGHAGGNNGPGATWSGTADGTITESSGSAELTFRAEAANKGAGADITHDVGDNGSNHATSFYLEVS